MVGVRPVEGWCRPERDVGLVKSELTSINTIKVIWVFVDNQFLEISECLLLVNDNPETLAKPFTINNAI